MATLASDVHVSPVADGASSSSCKKPKCFEIKKWNAVSLWAWDIVVDAVYLHWNSGEPYLRTTSTCDDKII